MISEQKYKLVFQIYLILGIALSLIAIALLLSDRSEAESAILWGLSSVRLLLGAGLLFFVCLAGGVLLFSFLRPQRFSALLGRLVQRFKSQKLWSWAVLLSICGALLGLYFLSLRGEINEPYFQALSERLAPLMIWFSGWCLLNLLLLVMIREKEGHGESRIDWSLILIFLAVCGLFFLPWLWVVRNYDIQTIDLLGWNDLGVPIIETQLLLAWSIGIVWVGLLSIRYRGESLGSLSDKRFPWLIDLILIFLLWLSAVILWSRTPLTPSWFVSEPRPPNNAIYPNSDALLNDLSAQVLLAGQGYHYVSSILSQRPLYTLFLAAVHAIVGQDYERVVMVQILVLALIPVLIYLVSRKLLNRLAGLLAGLLILFREMNAVALADTVTASHVKTLMVDLPVLLVVLLLTLLLMNWVKSGGKPNITSLLSGGVLGALVLLRLELSSLVLGIIPLVVISGWKNKRQLFLGLGLFLVGILLVISPWIVRNIRLVDGGMGDIIKFNFGFVAWRAGVNTGENLDDRQVRSIGIPSEVLPTMRPPFPQYPQVDVETPEIQGSLTQPQATSTSAKLIPEASSSSPGIADKLLTRLSASVVQEINSQTQWILIMPGVYRGLDSLVAYTGHKSLQQFSEDCCSLVGYVRRLPYWHKWDGHFPRQAILPILINLFLFAWGIRLAWKGRWLEGITPLVLSLSYISLNAMIQNSGGRYILPSDWVSVVYFSVGLTQLSILVGCNLTARQSRNVLLVDPEIRVGEGKVKRSQRLKLSWSNPWLYVSLACLLILGAALPVTELTLAPRYQDSLQQEMLDSLLASKELTIDERQYLEQELKKDDVNVMIGSALYPKFYPAMSGDPGVRTLMRSRTYPRIGFYLVGSQSRPILIPYPNKPAYLPNNALVLILSDAGRLTDALVIYKTPDQPVDVIIPELVR